MRLRSAQNTQSNQNYSSPQSTQPPSRDTRRALSPQKISLADTNNDNILPVDSYLKVPPNPYAPPVKNQVKTESYTINVTGHTGSKAGVQSKTLNNSPVLTPNMTPVYQPRTPSYNAQPQYQSKQQIQCQPQYQSKPQPQYFPSASFPNPPALYYPRQYYPPSDLPPPPQLPPMTIPTPSTTYPTLVQQLTHKSQQLQDRQVMINALQQQTVQKQMQISQLNRYIHSFYTKGQPQTNTNNNSTAFTGSYDTLVQQSIKMRQQLHNKTIQLQLLKQQKSKQVQQLQQIRHRINFYHNRIVDLQYRLQNVYDKTDQCNKLRGIQRENQQLRQRVKNAQIQYQRINSYNQRLNQIINRQGKNYHQPIINNQAPQITGNIRSHSPQQITQSRRQQLQVLQNKLSKLRQQNSQLKSQTDPSLLNINNNNRIINNNRSSSVITTHIGDADDGIRVDNNYYQPEISVLDQRQRDPYQLSGSHKGSTVSNTADRSKYIGSDTYSYSKNNASVRASQIQAAEQRLRRIKRDTQILMESRAKFQ